jgi:hypothetical protein
MNIFVLSKDLKACAKAHFDKHVVKMILESAQLLSSAVRLSGIDAGYKLTHKNHPCSLWVRESLSNWRWLKSLAHELNEEFKYRFNHINNHKSYDVISSLPEPVIEDKGLTPFVQCLPDTYKSEDTVEAYRSYYIFEKYELAKWTGRSVPDWFI